MVDSPAWRINLRVTRVVSAARGLVIPNQHDGREVSICLGYDVYRRSVLEQVLGENSAAMKHGALVRFFIRSPEIAPIAALVAR
jgi:hypothetical protein